MTRIHHHAGNLIVRSKKTGDFLTNRYDHSYPITAFRGKINLIGGGREAEDDSPIELLRREIIEEFSCNANQVHDAALMHEAGGIYHLPRIEQMASRDEIFAFRDALLSTMHPFADFLITFNPATEPRLRFQKVLISVYCSVIADEIFDIARKNLAAGASMVSDSFLHIFSIHDMRNGTITGAWGSQKILGEYAKTPLPNPFDVACVGTGLPRESFAAYSPDFAYTDLSTPS